MPRSNTDADTLTSDELRVFLRGVNSGADRFRRLVENFIALVELENGEAPPSYLAGTENFYVVTRYNWSSYYAMSVIDLGQEVMLAMRG